MLELYVMIFKTVIIIQASENALAYFEFVSMIKINLLWVKNALAYFSIASLKLWRTFYIFDSNEKPTDVFGQDDDILKSFRTDILEKHSSLFLQSISAVANSFKTVETKVNNMIFKFP